MKYIIILITIIFIGCGSTSTHKEDTNTLYNAVVTDKLPVAGLSYECGDIVAKTDKNGAFECRELPVVFKIGNLTVGSLSNIPADSKVYPQDIAGKSRTNFTDKNVIKITRLFQSLDNHVDNTKIVIEDDNQDSFDKEQNLTNVNNTDVKQIVEESGNVLVTEDEAVGNLKDSVEKLISIDITPKNTTIALGESSKFLANGIYSNGIEKDLTSEVNWTILDENIVSLYKSTINAQNMGNTTLKATYKNVSNSVLITVTDAYLVQLDINSSTTNIIEGTGVKFNVTGLYSNDKKIDLTDKVSWTSSDTNIINIDKDKNIKALKSGEVTLRASYEGEEVLKDITVTKAKLTSIEVIFPKTNLIQGHTYNLEVKGLYNNHVSQILTTGVDFNSSDQIVASVDKDGKITALHKGKMIVTVKVDNFVVKKELIVDSNEIEELLKVHDQTRADIGVTNKLVWSEIIVKDAQSYADEMAKGGFWRHDTKNHAGYANGAYGENLYIGNQKPTLAQAAIAWADEKQFYTYGVIGDDTTCVKGEQCGHYTQMIWKNTSEVGCAMSQYTTGQYKDWYIVVCKYQKPGNYLNETPY